MLPLGILVGWQCRWTGPLMWASWGSLLYCQRGCGVARVSDSPWGFGLGLGLGCFLDGFVLVWADPSWVYFFLAHRRDAFEEKHRPLNLWGGQCLSRANKTTHIHPHEPSASPHGRILHIGVARFCNACHRAFAHRCSFGWQGEGISVFSFISKRSPKSQPT